MHLLYSNVKFDEQYRLIDKIWSRSHYSCHYRLEYYHEKSIFCEKCWCKILRLRIDCRKKQCFAYYINMKPNQFWSFYISGSNFDGKFIFDNQNCVWYQWMVQLRHLSYFEAILEPFFGLLNDINSQFDAFIVFQCQIWWSISLNRLNLV